MSNSNSKAHNMPALDLLHDDCNGFPQRRTIRQSLSQPIDWEVDIWIPGFNDKKYSTPHVIVWVEMAASLDCMCLWNARAFGTPAWWRQRERVCSVLLSLSLPPLSSLNLRLPPTSEWRPFCSRPPAAAVYLVCSEQLSESQKVRITNKHRTFRLFHASRNRKSAALMYCWSTWKISLSPLLVI